VSAPDGAGMTALDLAGEVRSGRRTAVAALEDCLAAIAADDPEVHAFNHVMVDEARAAASKKPASTAALAAIDVKIAQSEQQLLDAAGLLHRDWFKHLLYAPGFYTGYGVKTMPGVREAIEQAQYESVPAEIARIAKAL